MHRGIIIALIVGICHVSGTSSAIRTTTTNLTLPTDRFFHDHEQLVASAQVFGACTNRRWQGTPPCPFYLETNRSIDSSDHLIGCKFDVTFPRDPSHDYGIARDQTVTIAKDKALLILSHGCVHNLYVLHFSECRAAPVEYNDDASIRACTWDFFVHSPRDDHFDVLLDGPTKGLLRRLTVNFDGRVVGDVAEWFPFAQVHGKSFLYSPTKGRLVAFLREEIRDQKKWVFKILAIDDKGQNHTLKKYEVPARQLLGLGDDGFHHPINETIPNIGTLLIAVTNDLLSACLGIYWETVTCVQYDADGELKFEVHLPINDDATGLYNLAGGGFLLLIESCLENHFGRSCPPEKNELTVGKIDVEGNFVASLKIPPFNCHDFYSQVIFFEAENGEHCFSIACPREDYHKEETNVYHRITCFREEDYIKHL